MNDQERRQEAKQGRREADWQRNKKHLDEMLDEALAETFPASDPIELAGKPD